MLECFSVRDKTIIITGALGLLGTACTDGFSEDVANVVIVDLDGEICHQRAVEIAEKYGTKPLGIGCNITSPEEVAKMVQRVVSEYGCIDVLNLTVPDFVN